MITVICGGWNGVIHDPPLVLREKVGTDGYSHSMCPACARAMAEATDDALKDHVARKYATLTELDFHGGEQ